LDYYFLLSLVPLMANKYTELNTEFNILIVHMQLLSEICHFYRHINLKLCTINKGILYKFKDLTGGNRYLHCTSLYYFKLPVRSIMVACITLLQQYCTYYNATIKIIIHHSFYSVQRAYWRHYVICPL